MTEHSAFLVHPDIDPVVFRMGPVAVRWYGLAYLLGFAITYFWLRWLVLTGRFRVNIDRLGDLLTSIACGVVVGGRLGWWLFYHRGPMTSWLEPFAIWEGGMSFHGALAGLSISTAIWCYRSKTSFLSVSDALAQVAPLTLFFGRLANFINKELVGRPTELPWGVIFPPDTFARHPSQLYEAMLEGPVLFLLLISSRWLTRSTEGTTGSLFLILYSCMRFGVEFTREPDPQIGFIAYGWLTMGQVLSVVLSVTGLLLLLICQQRARFQPLVGQQPPG